MEAKETTEKLKAAVKVTEKLNKRELTDVINRIEKSKETGANDQIFIHAAVLARLIIPNNISPVKK